MSVILLIISIILNLLGYGILRNEFCKHVMDGKADLQAFNTVNSLAAALTLTVVAACSGSLCVPSLYTLLMGIVFGLITGLCSILVMAALEHGPLSYTNLITSCAMVIPALSGMVLYGEMISVWQYAGIALMLVSFACAIDRSGDFSDTGMSGRWFVLCLGAFVLSGSVGVMQKLQQNSPYKEELAIFLVIAFLVSALLSAGILCFYKRKNGSPVTVFQQAKLGRFLFFAIGSGIAISLVNQINLYLAGVMQAVILYPVINGASMMLHTAAGILLWKEHLSKKQWFGIAAGGIAILLLCDIL